MDTKKSLDMLYKLLDDAFHCHSKCAMFGCGRC